MSEVQWRPWDAAAFAEAKSLNKPILLDIGAVWCHWCHVMDHGIPGDPVHTGTYSNQAIAERINRDYIPIKVDNDRRPDINARYNMGGWPTTAFLTPDGEPLYGATYLTPDQMAELLDRIAQYYRDNKDDIAQRIREHAVWKDRATPSPVSGDLTYEIGDFVCSEIKRSFDRSFGGFGTQPKFPHPESLNFALERFAVRGDDEQRIVAVKTLSEMASGGMYDQFAGGFFRYSTTRDWSVPHYEKMLEDNSRLLKTYLLAYQILQDEQFQDVARDVHRFLMEVLFDPLTGTFAGSQDADQEDAYYGRPLSERELMPTPFIDRTIYVDWNALVVSALTELYKQVGNANALAAGLRLYEYLTANAAPHHFVADGTAQGPTNLLTDTGSLFGAALDLFEVTGDRRYLSDARGLADTALTGLYQDEIGLFSDIPTDTAALGSLSEPKHDQQDNATMAKQLIRLFDYSGAVRYRDAAEMVLSALSTGYREMSYFSSTFARAVDDLLSPPTHIVLVGDLASDAMESLKSSAFRTFARRKTVELRKAEEGGEYPPAADGCPVAYCCIGTVCSPPIVDSGTLTSSIRGATA